MIKVQSHSKWCNPLHYKFAETNLFHFHRIFKKKCGGGGEGVKLTSSGSATVCILNINESAREILVHIALSNNECFSELKL